MRKTAGIVVALLLVTTSMLFLRVNVHTKYPGSFTAGIRYPWRSYPNEYVFEHGICRNSVYVQATWWTVSDYRPMVGGYSCHFHCIATEPKW